MFIKFINWLELGSAYSATLMKVTQISYKHSTQKVLWTVVEAIHKMNCHISRSHITKTGTFTIHILFGKPVPGHGTANNLTENMTLTWYCRTDSFKVLWVTHCHAAW
jgi:hypothetical protein